MTIATSPGSDLQLLEDDDEGKEVQAFPSTLSGEVAAQVDTAHKYPRSVSRFTKAALAMATLTEEVAQSCIYSLPRGGKPITGPSIRLAEICASAWGNLHMGARVLGHDAIQIVAQGAVWDLERNTRVTIEVRRRITGKDGKTFSDDMIIVTGNAASSIALRNAIFRVIPKAYVDVIYDHVRKVAVGDAMTLAERRGKVVDKLAKMGADLQRVLAALGRAAIDDVNLDDLETLIGFGTAIKNGDKTVDECFPAMAPVPGAAVEGKRISLKPSAPAAVPEQPKGGGEPAAAGAQETPKPSARVVEEMAAAAGVPTKGAIIDAKAEPNTDPDAADRKAAEPTAAEVAAHEAEKNKAPAAESAATKKK